MTTCLWLLPYHLEVVLMQYLLLAMKSKKGLLKNILFRPRLYHQSYLFWNSVIILNKGKGKYCHQYITDKDDDNVFY